MIGRVLAFMRRQGAPLNTIVYQLRQRTGYVRATEVMAILGVTRNTLCDWINSGILPAFRIGKNNVCDPAEQYRSDGHGNPRVFWFGQMFFSNYVTGKGRRPSKNATFCT